MEKFISFILAAVNAFCSLFSIGHCVYDIDASVKGKTFVNPVSNVNLWEMGTSFYSPQNSESDDVFDFVEYVQLMQCTGGNAARDLFKNPEDRSVMDDYDFERLIRNCRGILDSGAKPCLKLGNVPMKYSKNCKFGGFEVNTLPPDDYNVYYNYIHAIAEALVAEFGKEEVLTWHFCVYTEYENADWFVCENPDDTPEAFFKIYDYTVAALTDVIGEVYVGAHSMTVTEGLWDEAEFIKHCAVGKNCKTGKTGTRLNFLSASYYEESPGNVGKRKTLAETINYLRKSAEKYGLELDYGIDEGRILSGNISGKDSSDLLSRTVGYTYQAAFDARIYGIVFDNDFDYFSMWSYKSNGLNSGNPTVSYHVANHVAKFAGSVRSAVKKVKGIIPIGSEVKMYAGFDEENNTVRVMAYNYKNKIDYKRNVNLELRINAPQFKDGKVKVTRYLVNDDCNYFDDWLGDRKEYNITDDCFSWSPECPCIGSVLRDEKSREIYYSTLESKYAECAKLTPVTSEETVSGGKLVLDCELGPNNVVFFDIKPGCYDEPVIYKSRRKR